MAPNPGPMTLAGTNTYIVGGGPAYVIDPGPDDAAHLEAVREAAAGEIAGVLLTHGHSDHTAGAEALGAPVLWGEAGTIDEAAAIAAALGEPQISSATDPVSVPDPPRMAGPFTVIPTPGHAADHVAFLRDGVCFGGDLVLGQGSTIVPPAAAGGSLLEYMASLRRVAELEIDLLAPGHGPWITEPRGRIADYIEHRLDRERRLVAALEAGERSRERLLDLVWDDVPAVLRPAAAIAMQAHLEKLEAERRLPAGVGLGFEPMPKQDDEAT